MSKHRFRPLSRFERKREIGIGFSAEKPVPAFGPGGENGARQISH
ncbi:hypothetical protein [Paenibacillus ginsengarvi]|nr:hypothetical protein [Paenibacillus ginsengarvi]